MDKRFQKIKKIISLCLVLVYSGLGAQTPSVVKNIRFSIWSDIDAYPGLKLIENEDLSKEIFNKDNQQNLDKADLASEDEKIDESDEFAREKALFREQYSYAISQIKEITPFLLNGMIYGWEFVYVPSDKARKVDEYFEIKVIQDIEKSTNQIVYSSPWVEDNRFCCWVNYERTDHQIQLYNLWASINNPSIQGRGYGSIEKGFDGIKEASEDALKNAVREYYRGKIKNKPKEITGKVLIRKNPVIGINQGRYVINLDFFLECGKIKEYSQF